MRTNNDILQEGTVLAQLFHKSIRSHSRPVVVDFDLLIGEPQRVPGIGWAVPCDVVGLTSKKAKIVKVRFHPSVIKLSQSDQTVAHAAVRDSLKYLDALLDQSCWTRHAVKSVDPRISYVERIAHFLSLRPPTLMFTSWSLDLMWSLHPESRYANGRINKILADVRSSLHNHSIATGMVAHVQSMSGEYSVAGQQVGVLFEKNGLILPLLQLTLPKDSDYLRRGTMRDCWRLESEDLNLHISLPRSIVEAGNLPVVIPKEINAFVIDNHKEVPLVIDTHCHSYVTTIKEEVTTNSSVRYKMARDFQKFMESRQLRVDDLRLRLDQSLAAFQKAAQQRDKARSLHIVRQSRSEAIIEINNPGERTRFDRLLVTSPLNVMCGNGGAGSSAFVSSPTDSTDSGVAISPLSSPFCHLKFSPFSHHTGMRQRSASECGDWDDIVLKSILKKPHRCDRFSRSQSESHHCAADALHHSLLMNSTAEVSECEDHTDIDSELMSAPRKKRVSFSENVQERRFRAGQCILTAARKNEKKRAYRKRKEERERAQSESFDGSHTDDSPLDIDEAPGVRSIRQDSGFVDGDEHDCERDETTLAISVDENVSDSEERWRTVLRQQRELSSLIKDYNKL